MRYGFAIPPNDLGDAATDKGAAYLYGRMDDIVIDKLTLYHNGFVVDTRRTTHDSESIAQNILMVARELLGSKAVVNRKHFVSQVVFASDMRLSRLTCPVFLYQS